MITDAKGMFTISVPDNGTLVFSAVGFISSEVAVKNNKVINVFLTEQVSSLSDVVVVGYGTAKKKTLREPWCKSKQPNWKMKMRDPYKICYVETPLA